MISGQMIGFEKKLYPMAQTHRQTDKTDRQTDGHRDSRTESAPWANSKIIASHTPLHSICHPLSVIANPLDTHPTGYCQPI